MLLIRGGRVFGPEEMGEQDVLIAGGRIVKIGRNLEVPAWPELEVRDAKGKLVLPGFLDIHEHLIGGGGEGGPSTRNFDIPLTRITRWGVTTVAGVLGVDATTKHVTNLLGKVMGLELEGITAFAYVGSYTIPPDTLTGDVTADIAFVDRVVGAKIAVSDHRGSQPTVQEIARLAAQARMGGLVGRKAGVLLVHVGPGRAGLQPIMDTVEQTEIPIGQFYPTHLNRSPVHLEQAIAFAKRGGWADLTAAIAPRWGFSEAIKPSAAIRRMLDAGAPLDRITMTSDANGNMVKFDADGRVTQVVVQSVESLLEEFRDLVLKEGVPLPDALKIITLNPARVLRIADRKGSIAPGRDGDVTVLETDFTVRDVYARGRALVRDGRPVARGVFEGDDLMITLRP